MFAIEIGEVVAFAQKVFGSGESRVKLDIAASKLAYFRNRLHVFEEVSKGGTHNTKPSFVFVKMTIAIVNGVMLYKP